MTERDTQTACGTQAADAGERRSSNPHPVGSEPWGTWMDAFDAAIVRRERERHRPPAALTADEA